MDYKRYVDRLVIEVLVLRRKNFFPYFAVVKELVDWSREKEIMMGPGRGSVGGSLFAYLLDITQVDPLKYGLLFERFISEDRTDYPDIDIDWEDVKCDQVRKHIEQEYGEFNVTGISTFLTMKGRGVVRDVGRVFELPASEVDVFAKSIRAGEHDEGIVTNAGKEKEGQQFIRKYPEEFRLMEILEGQIRGAGQHPAGLIISGKDLRSGENGSLCRRSDVLVCNWDMEDCEYNGLIKIDVLKLGTLTVLNEVKRLLFQEGKNTLYVHPESECWFVDKEGEIGEGLVESVGEFDYSLLPLDDPKIFRMLSEGDTAGIFQFSGYATTELCKKMGVDSFEDMVAVTALARPGPAESGMTDAYVRRKKGESWTPLHPVYEEITKATYGVIVYQEQMMRAMVDLAGFSNSDSDRVRKVIGKKRKAEEFEPYREAFLKGCREKKTLTSDQALEFWQGLLEWAHYGFVKAHAVEYAMIGYWTAWVKLYHPTEFFCAQLTYGSEKGSIIKDAERAGMKIVTPKVGLSDARKWISREGLLYMPFMEIKGIGETQADKCAVIRSGSRFSRQGFFQLKESPVAEAKGKLEKLLMEVKAFDPDPSVRPDNSPDYFQYPIQGIDQQGKIKVIRKQMVLDLSTQRCTACGLRKQANQVVPFSSGMYNALILGEAPGKEEDLKGRGFVGDAGQLLWDELSVYKITRRMLHVSNCCKCWPSRTKTPSRIEVEECFNRWLKKEIFSMDCRLILATGNVPLGALTGKDSGITGLSGQMEWVESVRAWVVWCVHPSAVLRNRGQNLEPFRKGVKKFAGIFNKEIGR